MCSINGFPSGKELQQLIAEEVTICIYKKLKKKEAEKNSSQNRPHSLPNTRT